MNIQLDRSPETFIADLREICPIVDEDATDAPFAAWPRSVPSATTAR